MSHNPGSAHQPSSSSGSSVRPRQPPSAHNNPPAPQPHQVVHQAPPQHGAPAAAGEAPVPAAVAAAVAAAAAAGQAGEWNQEECDRYSFDDSDRFEEDSLCSWSSEPESLCNNWRGWKRPTANSTFSNGSLKKCAEGECNILVFISEQVCFAITIRHLQKPMRLAR